MHIGRLAEVDNTKHILGACDGLSSLVIAVLRDIACDRAFLLLCRGACLLMPPSPACLRCLPLLIGTGPLSEARGKHSARQVPQVPAAAQNCSLALRVQASAHPA